MKKLVLGGAAVLLGALSLGVLGGATVQSKSKPYILETLVPDQIFVVREPEDDKEPAQNLIAGLKEISEKYRIEKTEGITQFVGGGMRAPASATEALIVYVKPKT